MFGYHPDQHGRFRMSRNSEYSATGHASIRVRNVGVLIDVIIRHYKERAIGVDCRYFRPESTWSTVLECWVTGNEYPLSNSSISKLEAGGRFGVGIQAVQEHPIIICGFASADLLNLGV